MNAGQGDQRCTVEDERQQRAGPFLRDVAYRLHAELDAARASHARSTTMFLRRAAGGQWVNPTLPRPLPRSCRALSCLSSPA